MCYKRFNQKIAENTHLIIKITYEEWCDHLHAESYILNDEVLGQVRDFHATPENFGSCTGSE